MYYFPRDKLNNTAIKCMNLWLLLKLLHITLVSSAKVTTRRNFSVYNTKVTTRNFSVVYTKVTFFVISSKNIENTNPNPNHKPNLGFSQYCTT